MKTSSRSRGLPRVPGRLPLPRAQPEGRGARCPGPTSPTKCAGAATSPGAWTASSGMTDHKIQVTGGGQARRTFRHQAGPESHSSSSPTTSTQGLRLITAASKDETDRELARRLQHPSRSARTRPAARCAWMAVRVAGFRGAVAPAFSPAYVEGRIRADAPLLTLGKEIGEQGSCDPRLRIVVERLIPLLPRPSVHFARCSACAPALQRVITCDLLRQLARPHRQPPRALRPLRHSSPAPPAVLNQATHASARRSRRRSGPILGRLGSASR